MANILNCVTMILYKFKVFCSHLCQSKVHARKSYPKDYTGKGTSRDDCKLNFVRHIWMNLFLAGWCYYWKNAYYVKELLLCLTWKRWSWTCKTWFVCTRFKYQALSCPCFCAPTSMLCCYIYIIVMSLLTAGECPLDPGGYFVIKGTEKVLFWLSYYSAF
jgi:hypothetical protein